MTTVEAALAAARASGVERLDAQLLLGRLLGRDRAWLLAHGDAPLVPDVATRFDAWLERRRQGEPVAYLLGEKEFHGLRLQVDSRVLVPRPDTEVLVDWAIELLRGELSACVSPAVIDLGTGSGAIALAVRHACPQTEVTATDASADALAVAQGNASRLDLPIAWVQGSWWDAVTGKRFHLALSNPPYIPAGDAHLADLTAEPRSALSPGPDGLASLRAIVGGAPGALRNRGWLLLEHGYDQADAVRTLLQAAGLSQVETRYDLGGHPRCTGGRL